MINLESHSFGMPTPDHFGRKVFLPGEAQGGLSCVTPTPYADADINQGQHAPISRTWPGACCAFDDSVYMSATLRRLVRESERCAVF